MSYEAQNESKTRLNPWMFSGFAIICLGLLVLITGAVYDRRDVVLVGAGIGFIIGLPLHFYCRFMLDDYR